MRICRKKHPILPDLRGKWRETASRFEKFYAMLTENNAAFNLTAITEREEVIHKHFLDSLAGAAYLPRAGGLRKSDRGRGFPSVPLAIVRRDVSFTLIESTGKKCAFLRKVSEALGAESDRGADACGGKRGATRHTASSSTRSSRGRWRRWCLVRVLSAAREAGRTADRVEGERRRDAGRGACG